MSSLTPDEHVGAHELATEVLAALARSEVPAEGKLACLLSFAAKVALVELDLEPSDLKSTMLDLMDRILSGIAEEDADAN